MPSVRQGLEGIVYAVAHKRDEWSKDDL
jgi:hypothetical protein